MQSVFPQAEIPPEELPGVLFGGKIAVKGTGGVSSCSNSPKWGAVSDSRRIRQFPAAAANVSNGDLRMSIITIQLGK